LIYAGKISNALESVGPENLNNNVLIPQSLKLSKIGLRYYNTELEVWGINLRSTVGEKFTRKELAMVKLPNHIQGIMIGFILSDASFSKTYKNALLRFKQSLEHFEYLWFVFNNLSHYCYSYPKLYTQMTGRTRTYELLFYTRSLPCITELHSLFYVNRIKIIPQNIYEFLTPIALAHWIMGDVTRRDNGLTLCTNSYSIQEIVLLMNVLIVKYRFVCTLRKDKGKSTIYISEKYLKLLRTIVLPHMVPSMLYKIGLEKSGENYITTSSLDGTELYYCPTFNLIKLNIPEKFQRQGINQQEINKLTNYKCNKKSINKEFLD
jgi:hypothetical protein